MASGVSSGIRRKVDDLGRVVIPAGIRRTLNIREGDAVEVSVDGERVVLSKPRDACVFCGREGDDLHRFRGRLLCRECVSTIGQVDGRLRSTEADPTPPPAPASPATPATPATAPLPAPSPPPAPAASAHASAPATGPPPPPSRDRTAAADEPPGAPPAWPTGPIDGDAFAREQARHASRSRASAADTGATDDVDGAADHDDADEPRRPPYDPASTTAW